MRKINLRWAAALVFLPCLLSVLVYFLHGYQMGRNAHVFLREAKRAQAENRPQDAVNYFRRYLKLAPKDNEGLILYGFQLADLNQFQQAFSALDRAIQKQPDRSDVRRRLVLLCLRTGRFSDAIDHIENHLLKESPSDGELLQQKAIGEMGNSEFSKAETTFKAGIAQFPDRLDDYVLLASLQENKLNHVDDAIETLNQMVAENPEQARAYFLRAQWMFQQLSELRSAPKTRDSQNESENKLDKYRKQVDLDVDQALKLSPDDPDIITLATQVYQKTGRLDDARKMVAHGLEKHPSTPHFYTLLSGLETESANPQAALAALQKGALIAPKNLEMKWNLTRQLIENRKFTEAKINLTELRDSKFSEPMIELLEARILFLNSEWLPAIEKLERLRPQLTKFPTYLRQIDFWLGVAYREINSPEQQLTSFRRAVASDPNWQAARLGLAESLAALEMTPEAIEEYRQICSEPSAPESARIALAKLLLRRNLTLTASNRNWDEFDDVLKKIEASGTENTLLAVLRMQRNIVAQDLTKAEQTISAARQQNDDQIDLWTAEFDLALGSRDAQRIDNVIQEAEKRFGDTVAIRLMKGRALVVQRRPSQETIAEMRTLAEPLASWTQSDRDKLAEGFAPIFLLIGDYDDAERLAMQIALAQPKNIRIRLLLFDIARRAKRPQLLEGVLNDIQHVAGEGAIWHYGQAERLVMKAQDSNDSEVLKEALGHLEKAKSTRSTWERIPLLTAEIYERRGDGRMAIAKYLEAIRMGEKSPTVTSRVLGLLIAAQRFDDADNLIRQLRESQALFTDEMAKAEIALAIQLGRKKEAKDLVQKMVGNQPRSLDPLWLGQAYLNLEEYSASAEQFRAAANANGKAPGPWVGLVRALVLGKQLATAEEVVEEAKNKIASEQVEFTLGQCYELLGNQPMAREHYRLAVEQSPGNPDLSRKWIEYLQRTGAVRETEATLRTLLSNDQKGASASDRANRRWLQRNLAIALLARGNRDASKEALVNIEKNLHDGDAEAPEDLRLKANILAKGESRADRQEAISILENLVSQETKGQFQAEDHWLLANLYQAEGDLKKWRSELRRSMTDHKDDVRFVAAFVKLCLLEKDYTQAELYLDSLEKQLPDDLLAADLRGQLLYARDQYEQLENLLKKIGSQKPGGQVKPEVASARQYWAGRQFEFYANKLNNDKKAEIAKQFNGQAESLLSKVVGDNPQEIMLLADFFAGTDQIDRSLELLKENLDMAPVGHIIGISRKIMKNSHVSSDQLARLQELVGSKFHANPTSLALALTDADLMSWRGDFESSAKSYRKLIQEDPKNTVALNNLAVLLALSGGDPREAMSLVQKAIEIGGPVEALLDTRGLVHLAAGHSDKAALDFEKAISEKETAEEHFHAAIAYSRIDRLQNAVESLKRAEELGLVEQDLHPIERGKLSKLRSLLGAANP